MSGELLNEGEGANVGGETMVGTKLMMDEIEKGNNGGSFARVVLGQSSGDVQLNSSGNTPELGGKVIGTT